MNRRQRRTVPRCANTRAKRAIESLDANGVDENIRHSACAIFRVLIREVIEAFETSGVPWAWGTWRIKVSDDGLVKKSRGEGVVAVTAEMMPQIWAALNQHGINRDGRHVLITAVPKATSQWIEPERRSWRAS